MGRCYGRSIARLCCYLLGFAESGGAAHFVSNFCASGTDPSDSSLLAHSVLQPSTESLRNTILNSPGWKLFRKHDPGCPGQRHLILDPKGLPSHRCHIRFTKSGQTNIVTAKTVTEIIGTDTGR